MERNRSTFGSEQDDNLQVLISAWKCDYKSGIANAGINEMPPLPPGMGGDLPISMVNRHTSGTKCLGESPCMDPTPQVGHRPFHYIRYSKTFFLPY
jgi:hypothetical protein